MHTLTIIQARMSSTRLPGKALLDLAGKPVLQHVVDRLADSWLKGHLLVATSKNLSDDPIADWCHSYKVDVYRGPLNDVLDRFHCCAKAYGATTIVRVTADCPLLDPHLLDRTIELLHSSGADYAATQGFPPGVGQEAFTRDALFRAWRDATSPHDREHVVPWMLNHPGLFRDVYVDNPSLTLDTPEDLERLRRMLA